MEENLKYRRHDIEGGYIFDKSDIDYYRAKQRIDISSNGMLGDFNMVGSYVVNKALVEELIKMYKVYTDTYNKTIFCESLKSFDNKKIKFSLNIISNSPIVGKVTASLVLLEEVEKVNGYYTDTNSVVIDSKVFDDKKDVEQKIFERYNIHHINESGAKVENDYDFPAVLRRLKYLKDISTNCNQLYGSIEKELYEKRLEAVMKSKFAPRIIEEFNRQVFHAKDPFLNKKDKLFYRYLNQILDNVIENIMIEIDDNNLINNIRKIQSKYAEAQYNIESVVSMKLQSQFDEAQRKEFEQYQKISKSYTVENNTVVKEVVKSKPEVKKVVEMPKAMEQKTTVKKVEVSEKTPKSNNKPSKKSELDSFLNNNEELM